VKSIKRKIILSGASGFTGRNLIRSIDQEKFEIVAVKRPSNSTLKRIHPNLKEVNVGNCKELERFAQENEIAGIFHLATMYSRNESKNSKTKIWEANFSLGKELLEVSIQLNTQFLHVESYLQYQSNNETEYLKSKIAFSTLVDQARTDAEIPITSLIFFDSYGVDDTRNKILSQLILGKIEKKKIRVTEPNRILILTSVQDLVESVAKTIEERISGRFRVASLDKFLLSDLLEYIDNFPHGEVPQRITDRVYVAESFPLLKTFVQTSDVVKFIDWQLSAKSENCL